MRTSTPVSPAATVLPMSAAYQWYGATLLTKLVSVCPLSLKLCQLKLPLAVVS